MRPQAEAERARALRAGLQQGLLITPDRVAYYGPFGRPGMRCLGSWAFYLSPDRPFQLQEEGRGACTERFALVAPWTTHRVVPGSEDLAVLLVEPDSIDGDALRRSLMASPDRRRRTAARIERGFCDNPIQAKDIDLQFFGDALPRRWMDHRVRRAIDFLASPATSQLSVDQCAIRVSLSSSRLMHLFSEQTHTTYRRFRAWKRARRFLGTLAGRSRLIDVALDAGYADSTHLSRSVRSCYGYTPSALCECTRGLSVVAYS